MNKRVPLAFSAVCVAFLALSCAEPSGFQGRSAVGSLPAGFEKRAVTSVTDAADYAGTYIRALGLEDLGVTQVADVGIRYFVYVDEVASGRAAFSLDVSRAGEIEGRQFPAMEPEMMWNQKYGHRARERLSSIRTKMGLDEARILAAKSLQNEPSLGLGSPREYYGYYLFPLRSGNRLIGEAAVNGADGTVVWARYPKAFRSMVDLRAPHPGPGPT